MTALYFLIAISILLFLVLFSEKSTNRQVFLRLIAFTLLIPVIIVLSFILQVAIEEWEDTGGGIMIVFYYFSFTTLLLATFFTKKISHRYKYILLLLLFCPTIFLSEQRNDHSSSFYIGISGTLWSIVDLISNSKTLFYNHGKLNLTYGIETKNSLVIYQGYSILFGTAISVVLMKIKTIYRTSFLLYLRFKYFIIISVGISFFFVFIYYKDWLVNDYIEYVYKNNTFLWYKALIYLLIYFSLFASFLIIRKRCESNWYPLILLIFIFLFPIVNITTTTVNTIYMDSSYIEKGRCIDLIPSIIALPTTLKYLVHDINSDVYRDLFSIKLYSLFQMLMVLFIFPSILTPKTNQHG